MAENPGESPKIIFGDDCDRVTDNGDGHLYERKQSPMNGKRSSDDEISLVSEINGTPSSKKSKTILNGIDHSPVALSNRSPSTVLHNGDLKDKTNSHSGRSMSAFRTMDSHNEMPNGNGITSNMDIDLSTKNIQPKPMTNIENLSSNLNMKKETNVKVEESKPTFSTIPIKKELKEEASKVNASTDREPEIITLSDSEDEFQEVLMQAMSLNSPESARWKLLKLYQDQLRAEETKLILLRKLKQSLVNVEKQPTANATDAKVTDIRNQVTTSSNQRAVGGNIPPPLKRGHQQMPGQLNAVNTHSSSQHHKVSSNHHHQSSHASDRAKLPHQSNGPSSSGPPPLVNMAKSSPHSSSNGGSAGYSGNYQTPQVSQPKKAAPPPPPQLTAEQKLTGAKIALKKQLEQALQQVPAPKPPPPEVNFLPSLAHGEFVYLIGMEEVVKQLLSTDQKDVKFVFNPFSCVQCDTDFTPVWKRDKPGSKNVICEKCITSNQKRVLKQEHTTKLKAVFSKALQKEQEIERRVAAGSPLSDMPGLAAVVARQQHSSAAASSSGATPSMPQLTQQHIQSSSSPNSQQLSTSQLQQQQALLQAQAAEQMRAMIAAQMALPYQLYGVNKQAADSLQLQRQYLLDMINQNRSWKT